MPEKQFSERLDSNWYILQGEIDNSGERGVTKEELYEKVGTSLSLPNSESKEAKLAERAIKTSISNLLKYRAEDNGYVEIRGRWYNKSKVSRIIHPYPTKDHRVLDNGMYVDIVRRERINNPGFISLRTWNIIGQHQILPLQNMEIIIVSEDDLDKYVGKKTRVIRGVQFVSILDEHNIPLADEIELGEEEVLIFNPI